MLKHIKPAGFKGAFQDALTPLTSQETLQAFQGFQLCYGESFGG